MKSTKFTLSGRDWWKTLAVTIGSAFVSGVITGINAGQINKTTLKVAGVTALSAGATYIFKNFITDDVKVAQKTIDEAATKELERLRKAQEQPVRQ